MVLIRRDEHVWEKLLKNKKKNELKQNIRTFLPDLLGEITFWLSGIKKKKIKWKVFFFAKSFRTRQSLFSHLFFFPKINFVQGPNNDTQVDFKFEKTTKVVLFKRRWRR